MMVGHGHKLPLASSTGENEINIPPRLESDSEIESDIYYMIDVKQGQTEIFAGIQTTNITLKNSLDEETTLHWHGLIIDSEADGGPHTVIQPGEEKESEIYNMIDIKQGQTEIFAVIQTTNITLKNSLDEETTLHWHGLIIDSEADGGPHTVIQPGEEKEITFDVQQDRATLWFHPHPEGKTAEQVFGGLAGLLYFRT